ncbi:hypothetical protein MIR68_010098 [Amoeboaphelidium protococcarum]|nr:hypothetical protein MIR68_010098 [Amoeboaphelidium protococcarum]
MAQSTDNIEDEYVLNVYEQIAPHFSNTRYKMWPIVKQYLDQLSADVVPFTGESEDVSANQYLTTQQKKGVIVGDFGCGNGKNMLGGYKNILFIGTDNSLELLSLVPKSCRVDSVRSSVMDCAFRPNVLSHAISIAVLHHLTSEQRRVEAIVEMIRAVQSGGTILIFVWAQEQSETSKIKHLRPDANGDVFVPWRIPSKEDPTVTVTYQRYYHLFRKGEIDEMVRRACTQFGCKQHVLRSGYDRDNWYICFQVIKHQ